MTTANLSSSPVSVALRPQPWHHTAARIHGPARRRISTARDRIVSMLGHTRIWSAAATLVVAAVLSACASKAEQTHQAPVPPSMTQAARLSEEDSLETVSLTVARRLVGLLRKQPASSVHASNEFGAGLLTTYKEIGSGTETLSRPQLH